MSEARPQLESAHAAAAGTEAALTELDRDGLTGSVASAVDQATSQLGDLLPTLEVGARAARLLPPMLGENAPRRYLLAFQNPAESRGTGGIVGMYAIVRAESGRLSIDEIGQNGDFPVPREPPYAAGAVVLVVGGVGILLVTRRRRPDHAE